MDIFVDEEETFHIKKKIRKHVCIVYVPIVLMRSASYNLRKVKIADNTPAK